MKRRFKLRPGAIKYIMEQNSNMNLPYLKDCDNLTLRQLEVLRLIKLALPDKIMADKLGISIHTLNAHKRSIFEKLRVHSKLELLVNGR